MNAEAIVDESDVVVPLTLEQISVDFDNYAISQNQLSSDEVQQISRLMHDVQINSNKVSAGLKSVAKIFNSKVINEENQDQFEVMIENLVLLSFNGYRSESDGVYYSPFKLQKDLKNQQLHHILGLHNAREFIRKRSAYYIKSIKKHIDYFNSRNVFKTTAGIVPPTTAGIMPPTTAGIVPPSPVEVHPSPAEVLPSPAEDVPPGAPVVGTTAPGVPVVGPGVPVVGPGVPVVGTTDPVVVDVTPEKANRPDCTESNSCSKTIVKSYTQNSSSRSRKEDCDEDVVFSTANNHKYSKAVFESKKFSNLCYTDMVDTKTLVRSNNIRKCIGKEPITVVTIVIGNGEVEESFNSTMGNRVYDKVRLIFALSHHECLDEDSIKKQGNGYVKNLNSYIQGKQNHFRYGGCIWFKYPGEENINAVRGVHVVVRGKDVDCSTFNSNEVLLSPNTDCDSRLSSLTTDRNCCSTATTPLIVLKRMFSVIVETDRLLEIGKHS